MSLVDCDGRAFGNPVASMGNVGWCTITAGFLASANRIRDNRLMRQSWLLRGTVAFALLIAVQEFPHQLTPAFKISPGAKIYVIGDSISAGMGRDKVLWPTVLSEITGLSVTNLAQPGATVASAQKQIAKLPKEPCVVIVEIGGNDLLGGASAEQFRGGLQKLLMHLHNDGHQLLMFELPLYPLTNSFGRAQRELAALYGVTLIPKRFFTNVLGSEGATEDGLHLSPLGHQLFAKNTAAILNISK